MKIDVHNHFYPKAFLRQVEKDGPSIGMSVEVDSWGRQVLVHRGNRVVTITPPMTDVNRRIDEMDEAGVTCQILTLSIPSVDLFPIEVGENLARIVNDEIARICSEHPRQFLGFATLPFLDSDKSIKELERCVETLGFCGACIGSNINGIPIDNERFYPFYARMAEYGLPIHIHPRTPDDKQTYKDYRLGPMIGFEMDLCVAVVRLIMSGVTERFSDLYYIVSHLGGAIPYLAERIENCYDAYPECQVNLSNSPKTYLKKLYYDTVSFFKPALMCAYSFVGGEHLILGSDYPHVIGDIREAVTSIEALEIPQLDKDRIFSKNILNLIGGRYPWGAA